MDSIFDNTHQPISCLISLKPASIFQRARRAACIDPASFQFRDLRDKAGTDKAESSGEIRQAQRQLGHSNIAMTEHYIRGRGDKTTPTK